MSYILDALKQSERRRNGQAPETGPAILAEVPPPPSPPFYRRRLPWLLLILLLALPAGYGLGRFGVPWLVGPPSAPAPASQVTPSTAPVISGTHAPRILVEAPSAIQLHDSNTEPSAHHGVVAPPPAAANATPESAHEPGVPNLRALSAGIRARLPALTLSVHIYSPDPAARRAKINGQMLREGDHTNGLTVSSITAEGVILDFEGNEFHLYSVGG
ncbi:general secretion pathway protein GspB [Oceanimonas sp. NS1]|nr:general secretion pathway protein GspB [Oceanimonas sp. NS1]